MAFIPVRTRLINGFPSQALTAIPATDTLSLQFSTKELASNYDYEELRRRVYIPERISNASIRKEAPFCYRELDDCLALIKDLVTVEKRFKPFAYLGQL